MDNFLHNLINVNIGNIGAAAGYSQGHTGLCSSTVGSGLRFKGF